MGSLDWFRSVADYTGVAGRAIRRFKFHGSAELAPYIADRMRHLLIDAPNFDVVVPVPIHWSRRSLRGFNQSELLAEALTLSNSKLLIRTRATRPQTRVSGRERLTNLENALRARTTYTGLRALLIDDVVTSGSTLEACASALKAAGASWVGGVTYARG